MLYVADKLTGTFIDKVKNINDGLKRIAEYEQMDIEDGIYIPDFYDIVDENHCSVPMLKEEKGWKL